jgi:outer membrane lipoprotein
MRTMLLIAFGALVFMPFGCATDTASCRRPVGDRSLTPAVAAASGERAGERVTWGGTLVEARNLERETELEVVGMPLDGCGRPQTNGAPVGRFIIVRPGYLEAAELNPGALVTATGEVIGTREGQIGEAFYRFPLLRDPAPVIWRDRGASGGWQTRPMISIGVGAGSGGWRGGGIGVSF